MRKWKLLKTYPGSPELGFELNDRDYNIGLTGTVIINGTFNYDIFNQTEYWKEIIEKPEYVKCIINDYPNWNHGEIGKIYKVDNWLASGTDCTIVGSEHGSCSRHRFEPSTKEAYDLQELQSKFVVGKWYKVKDYSWEYIFKYNGGFSSLEYISKSSTGGSTYTRAGTFNRNCKLISEINVNSEEIQPYLPNDHVDKIKPVVVKDYEILSLKNTTLRTAILLKENYLVEWDNLCMKNHLVVNSVKRLSDGEVFTLNDVVKATDNIYYNGNKLSVNKSGDWLDEYNNTTIKEFKFVDDKLIIIYSAHKGTHGQLVNNVEKLKIKEPIKPQPKEELITVQLTKAKLELLMQLLEE